MKFNNYTRLLLNELWGTSRQGTSYHGGNPQNVNPTKVRDTNIYKPVDIKTGQTAEGDIAIAGTKEEMAIEEAGMTAARALLLFATALKSDPIIKNYMKKIVDDKGNLTPEEVANLTELEYKRSRLKGGPGGVYDGFLDKKDFIEYTKLIRKKKQAGLSKQDEAELQQLKNDILSRCFAIKKDGKVDIDNPTCVSATSDIRKQISEIEARANRSIDKKEIERIKGLLKRRLDTISSKDLKPQLDDIVEYIFDFIAEDPDALRELDLPKFMLGGDSDGPREPSPEPGPVAPNAPAGTSVNAKEGPSIKTVLTNSLPQIKELAVKLLSNIPNMLASTSKAIAALPDRAKNVAVSKTQNLLKNVNPDNVIELVFSGKNKEGVPVYAPSQADEERILSFKAFFKKTD